MNKKLLGETIKQLRDGHGLSQQQIAAKVRVTRQTWAAWENGIRTPSYTDRVAILAMFDNDNEYGYLLEGI